jgi:glycosyltransferase involved in cell wall biosynthesis
VYILVYAMERYYARRADCVLTVCSELVERFRAWGCKAYLLPNYARNYESLYYADDPIVSRLKREGFTVGIFAGGMYKERGIFELIEAARILKERGLKVSMVFAGWGSSSFLRKVEKCIKHNCLDDRIKIVEKKDHRSIINMMSQCDFGFINDYPEKRNLNSIAVKVFEYMMCSLPIYASNLPLNSRVVDELCCGVTADPLVPERIADSLERLCSSREYMKGLGENSRKAFETRYNWQIVEGMLIGCYRNLEGGKDV